MNTVSIEPFEARDTDEVLWLWRRSFEHGVGIIDPEPTIDGIHGYFCAEILPKDDVFVAKEGGKIVAVLASNRVSVSAVYVRIENIGHGIGSMLIDRAKASSDGGLWLFTFANNTNARRFYARHGFTEVEYGHEPFWKLDDVKLQWLRSPAPMKA